MAISMVVNCFQIVSLIYWSQLVPESVKNITVVNCFQIVSLIYWSQQTESEFNSCNCCELLSDCIFDILVTACSSTTLNISLLWIAFRLYLWYIGHSCISCNVSIPSVVNCFQIVSLIYWSQLSLFSSCFSACCELLSDCIFDILVTAATKLNFYIGELWIAFRLYLWYIGHSQRLE